MSFNLAKHMKKSMSHKMSQVGVVFFFFFFFFNLSICFKGVWSQAVGKTFDDSGCQKLEFVNI